MALSQTEIRDFLARARQGDVDAFAAVFEQYRSLLHGIAYRFVGPVDCDDVVMDTYLKVWRSIPQFKGQASIKTWLCKAVRNCALDHLRRRSRREAHHAEPLDDGQGPVVERIPDPAATAPDEAAARGELGRLLDEALAKLSDNHRTTFLLREVDGLSYGEIAAATDVSIGTVMSRLFHARRNLRATLAGAER